MKRLISYGLLSFVLLVSLIAFAACSQATYDEPVLEPVEALTVAVSDMREAREAANLLGVTPARPNPHGWGDAPTRSQLTLLLNGMTMDGQPMQEIGFLRPSMDVTVYSHPANDFYYIQGGLHIIGMPFPVVNIGIDGTEISIQLPLLYDRYITVDTADYIEDLMNDPFFYRMMQDMEDSLGYLAAWHEYQTAAMETITNALDFEALMLDMLEDLLEVAQVTVDGNQYSLIIPAEAANAALGAIWDVIFDAYALIDVSAFNGEFEDIWAESLVEGRSLMDEIRFTQDVNLVYVLDQGMIIGVEFEGFIGDEYDDFRIMVSYANNSGDHIGDIAWVVEFEESMTVWSGHRTETIRFEYTSTLDTSNGVDRLDSFSIHIITDWDASDGWDWLSSAYFIDFSWYYTRTEDGSFSAGFKYDLSNSFGYTSDFHMFVQGSANHGEDYFTLDLSRLGLEISAIDFDYEYTETVSVELSAFFRHEVVNAADVPTIDPANQFFVMDAGDEELERFEQQIEDSVSGLTSMFELFGVMSN